ncbi:MAG TPA: HEPN domain-containing protein [Candidatus Wallbacteria bacterium]|nr:HEPN domain-containing protein [Candidatus Wallbacteria bacterium]
MKTAKAMLDAGRYIYVTFMLEQAVEKLLKAIYVKELKQTPPYIHKLKKIAENLSIINELDEAQLALFDELSAYYIASRYGETIDLLRKKFKKKNTEELFNKTKDMYKWLKSKLK